MNTKGKYKTKQRENIIEYLKTVPEEHVTVSDVYEYFREKGKSMGQTTVYRQLERLVDEGLVNKYNLDPSSPSCFEYMDPDSHAARVCFHLKCEKCGKLIHLHCEEMDEMLGHMKTEHGFVMDPKRTVIYGICENCMQ
ncbi:MAG: transcriptional repressor [Clostridiales bacterium]|nr:transcriptional repressor [Clostridiales bacterium]